MGAVRTFCAFCVRNYARIFYRNRLFGVEHLKPGGGLIASNHASFLDPPLLGASCPEEIHFLARTTLFGGKFFPWLLGELNTHPVARGSGNIATFRLVLELVREGKKVVIFPEGTRAADGQLQPGQPGISMLALRARCPIYPLYIHGTFAIWSATRRLPRFTGKTALVFGSALDISKWAEEENAYEKIAIETMRAIGQLKEWYLAGAKGTPP